MYAVIFEVEVKPERKEEYLQIASELSNELSKIDGFISVERFQSLVNESRLASLSFWESEEAISKWRNNLNHKVAQQKGRSELFSGYRLRVAHVVRDYGLKNRGQAPA
ncbi:MAG: antibiotic biosynthesis monooxygenase [Deltaproteobacteria bacterium]|nr:MAG: antibiotic biosynthesis monooxygenase [Deltaproteobacteria bacterium]